jgi:hypothetical protein
MARAPKAATGTAVVDWEKEMERQAAVAAAMEAGAAAGQFFSMKAGVLSWNGAKMKDNRMGVIIVDHVLENVLYEGDYDPDEIRAPTCFAFGRDDKSIAPHEDVVTAGQAQHEQCKGCPMNEFGSADTGRGKACKNSRRLALISAGQFNAKGGFDMIKEAAHYQTTPLAYMKLPVTSVKPFAGFVQSVANAMKRPPWGVVANIYLEPDADTQFKVVVEALQPVPANLLPIIAARNQEASKVIEFPYSLEQGEKKPARPARGGGKYTKAGAAAAKGKPAARRGAK